MAVVFTVTTITIDPSGAFAYADAFQFLSERGTQNEFQTHLSALPAELGLVTRSWEPGRAVAGKPFVIQIQDAHSNPEAEQNIAGILRYLEEKFPDLTIGLEGAKGRLHPEYFEFFSEFPEANRAVVDDLRQKGELNGVELYLWDKLNGGLEARDSGLEIATNQNEPQDMRYESRVEGVEDAELYRENLKTFRDLLFRRDEIGTLLNPLRAQLEKESSKALNPDLRDFLKERERRKEGKFNMSQASGDPDLVAYIRYLKSQTLKVLQIDLTDTIEQLRFPNLIRVLLTEEAQKGFDQEAAKREWADVLDALRVSAKEKSELKFVKALETYGREQGLLPEAEGEQFSYPVERALYPRKLLEGLMLFIQKHPVDLKAYSHFMKSWKVLVLRSEVEITGLLDEMASLEENILERSAKTDTEKQFIERLNDLSLLTKLLHLELARPEYDQALDRRGDLEVLAKNIPNIKPFIAQAYQFYATSTKRDRAILENALAFSTGTHTSHLGTRETRNQNESRVPSPKSRVIVLVTGGFHTEGLEKLLQEEGIGYAVVSPRIRGVDGGERYQKVMTGANADLGAYFKTKNPFSTKQEAILFRQLLETAAPALFETYRASPSEIAHQVKGAIAAHPVLSKVLSAEPLRADQDKTLRFQTRASPLNITSQNAAVMPEALTGDSSFATFVAYGQGIEPVVTDITFGKADALTIHAVLSSSEPQTANLSDIIHVEYGQLPAVRSETRGGPGKNKAVTKTSEESFDRAALEKNLQKLVEMEKVQPVPKNGQASKFDELVANLLDTVGEYDPKKLSFLELKVIANNLLAEAEKDGRFDMKRIRRLLTPILGDSSDTVQDLLEQNTTQVIVEKGVLDLSTEQKKPGDPRSEMRIVGESTAEASVFAPLAVFANALPEEILYQAPKESFIGEAQKLNSIIEKTSENISRDLQKLLQKEADELKREIKIDLLLNRKTRTINLIGGLLRRLRTKGIQDPKRKPSLDHIMNQIKMYALQQLGFSGSAEEELEFAENALNDFVNDYEKRIQDLERKMEETERAAEAFAHLSLIDLKEAVKPGSFSKRAGIFNEIRKALENNAVTDPKLRDALEGTRRIYLDYAAKDSMKMMAQQTVLKPAQAYFKSEESKKETLERMKKEKKNFAAIFYEDVLSKKSAGLYDQQELYRSKGLPGMVQDWEEYISIAHRLIAELVSRHGKAKTFQIAMPEKSSGGVVLYISETMGVDKVEDIMTQFGSQIKAIVTTQANLSTHWVVVLQQYPNPPPVLVISPDDENEKLFQKLSAGDEVIVSATLGEEGIQGYFLLHPGKKEIQGAIEKERGDQLMRIAEKGSAHIKDSNLNFFANTFVGETQSVIESKAEGIGLTRSEVDKAITKMVEDIATTLALEIKSTQALQRAVQSLLEYLERAYHFESSDTSAVIKLLMDAIRELAKISSVPRNRRAAVKKIILSVQKKLEKYYNLKKVETSQNDDWLVDFVLNFFDSKDHPELFNSNIATFGSYLEKLYSIEPVNHLEVDPSLVELHNTIGRSTAILSKVPDRLKKSLDLFRLHLEQSYFAQLDNPSLVDKDQVFRTLDLWPDKNTDLFDALFKVFGYAAEDWNAFTEEYSGFNFYRTPLGKEILTQQVAALIIVQEQLLKSRQGQTPRLKLMFPQIDGLADIEFISNEILEQAEVVASQVLKERGTQEPKEMVSQIVETISYGAMVETPQAVQELEKILNFQRHGKPFVKFISVGTNDLEMKLLEKFLLEQTGVSVHANRDYAWAQPWIERLDPNNVELYLKIASTIADLNLRTGRNVGLSFCGEVASHDKFILFSKFLKKRFGNHLTLTLSMSPNKIAHAKLVSRHIDSSFDFSFLEHLVGDADQRASKKASDAFKKVSSILVVLEEWQSRYQKAGFDNAFYRLNIDPVKGEGSFEEFNFLKRLIVKLLWQDESEELRALRERLALDPKDEMTRDELERIIRHYRIKDFIGQKDQELLESREEDLLLLRRFDFLKSIRDVFREYQKDKKLKQNILHPSFVNDFLKFYRRHYELLGQTVEWLPTDDEKTFQAFFKEYREATTSVFDDIVLMSRRLLLNQFPPKYTPYDLGERVQRAGFASDQIELVTTEGFTFRRNVGWGYGRDHELHIKNAVELFTGRPELIFDVFALTVLYGVRISEKTQQAILQTKQQLDLLMERIRSGDPEVKDESTHLKNVFQEIFQSKNPASYALWRMHGLDVMDIFIPTYKTMRAFFEAGQRYSVDLQTMRALEILDTLEGKGNFFFLIPKQVMHEVAEHESMILTLRYAIFMDGIVRARIGSGASERSIRELVKETLYPVGIDSKTLDDIVWLLMSQREISKRDLLSQEQIDSLWGRFSANPGLTKERWTLLYLMTFSIRASLAEPEKMPLLIRLGQQSPLLYITQLFTQGYVMQRSMQTPNALDSLDLFRTLHEKRLDEVAWKWLEHRNSGELFEKYLEQTSQGNIPDLKTQIAKMLGIQEKKQDEKIFTSIFEKCIRLISYSYIRALDIQEIVTTLVFYIHLQLLKENKVADTVLTLFRKLPDNAREGYEILMGYPEYKPELVPIFSRVLYENGFILEEAVPHFGDEGAVIRFMGYFRHERGDELAVETKVKKIQEDLQKIYHSQGSGRTDFFASLFGVRHRPFDNTKRLYGNKLKLHKDYENWQGVETVVRFLSPSELFEDIPFKQEKIGRHSDVLIVETSDREGLLAAISTILYEKGDGVGIKDFIFDDVKATSPRGIFLVDKDGNALDKELKEKLSAYLEKKLAEHSDKPEAAPSRLARVLTSPGETGLIVVEETQSGAESVLSAPDATAEESEDVVIGEKTEEAPSVEAAEEEKIILETFYEIRGTSLHARPATILVKLVERYSGLSPRLKTKDQDVSMNSIMQLLMTESVRGSGVSIYVSIPKDSETGEKEAKEFFRTLNLEKNDSGYLFGDEELGSGDDKGFLKFIKEVRRSELRVSSPGKAFWTAALLGLSALLKPSEALADRSGLGGAGSPTAMVSVNMVTQQKIRELIQKGKDIPGLKQAALAKEKENKAKSLDYRIRKTSLDLWRLIENIYGELPQLEKMAMLNRALYIDGIESHFTFEIQRNREGSPIAVGIGSGQNEVRTLDGAIKRMVTVPSNKVSTLDRRIREKESAYFAQAMGLSRGALDRLIREAGKEGPMHLGYVAAQQIVRNNDLDLFFILRYVNEVRERLATDGKSLVSINKVDFWQKYYYTRALDSKRAVRAKNIEKLLASYYVSTDKPGITAAKIVVKPLSDSELELDMAKELDELRKEFAADNLEMGRGAEKEEDFLDKVQDVARHIGHGARMVPENQKMQKDLSVFGFLAFGVIGASVGNRILGQPRRGPKRGSGHRGGRSEMRGEAGSTEAHQNDPEQLLARVYTDQSRAWGTTDFTPILPSRHFPEDINHSGFPDNYQERKKFYQVVSSMLERVEDKTAPKDKTANKDRTVLVDFLAGPGGYVDIVVAAANEHEIVFGEAVQKAIGEVVQNMQSSDQASSIVLHPYLHSHYRNSKGTKVYASVFTLESKTLKALSEKEQQRIRRAIWNAIHQKRQQEEYKRKNHGREELIPAKDDPEARAREGLNRRLLSEENRKEGVRNLVMRSLAGLPSEHMAASTVGEERLWRLTDDLSELVEKSIREKGDPQFKIYNVSDIVPAISTAADHTELLIAVKNAPDTDQIVDAWLKEQGIEILRQYSRMIQFAHPSVRRPEIPNIQYVYLEIRSNGKALEKEAGDGLIEAAGRVLRAEMRTEEEKKIIRDFLEKIQDPATYEQAKVIFEKNTQLLSNQEVLEQLLILLASSSWETRQQIAVTIFAMMKENPHELAAIDNLERIMGVLGKLYQRGQAETAVISSVVTQFISIANFISEHGGDTARSEMRDVAEETSRSILALEPDLGRYPGDRSPELGNADQSIMKNRSLIHEIADYIMHPNDKTSRIYKLMEKSGVQDDRGMQYEILAKAQDLLHQEVETFDFKRILTAISTMQDVYRKENVVKGKAQVLGVLVELEIDLGQAGTKNPLTIREKSMQDGQKALELYFSGIEKNAIQRALSEKLNRSEARGKEEILRGIEQHKNDLTILGGSDALREIDRFRINIQKWSLDALFQEYLKVIRSFRGGIYLARSPVEFIQDTRSFEGDLIDTKSFLIRTYLGMMENEAQRASWKNENLAPLLSDTKDLLILWAIKSGMENPVFRLEINRLFFDFLKQNIPKIERPIEKIPAGRVKKIFILGHKGHGREKLGEELILYSHFIPLLLKKFPHAKIAFAVDYPNQFSSNNFKGKIFPVVDEQYQADRQEPLEPQDGVLDFFSVPDGIIKDAVNYKAEGLTAWLIENKYDLVFDFTIGSRGLERLLSKIYEERKAREDADTLPMVFSHMDVALTPSGNDFSGTESDHSPVLFLNENGIQKVEGTQSLGKMITKGSRKGQRPVYWEMVLRMHRALGLLPDGLDLQTLELDSSRLDEAEKGWLWETLRNMIVKKGKSAEDAGQALLGNKKFIYVNTFAQTNPHLVDAKTWIEVLSRILEMEDVFLIFSSGGFKDQEDQFQHFIFQQVFQVLEQEFPNKRGFILRTPDNLSVGKVQDLMMAMDLVITPDTGFSHLATATNVPQIEFLPMLRTNSHWATYRENSFIVDSDFFNYGPLEPAFDRIQRFASHALSQNISPRRHNIWKPSAATDTSPGLTIQNKSQPILPWKFRKVLVVDDDKSNRLFAIIKMKKLGLQVDQFLEAANAEEALKLYRENEDIDLVLTDIRMPGKWGDDFAKEAYQIRPDVPFLFMSGGSVPFVRENRIEMVVVGLIFGALPTKPFTAEELAIGLIDVMTRLSIKKAEKTEKEEGPPRSEMRKASQAEINKMIEGLGLQEAAELSPFVFAWKKRLFADVHPGNGAAHEAELSNMKLDLDRQKALPWQDFKRYLITQAQELEEAGFSGITDRIEVEIRAALKNAKEDPRIAGIKNDGEKAKQIVIRAKTILSGQFQRSVWYQYARESQNAKAGKIFGKDDLLIRDMPTVAQIPFIVLTPDQQIHWEVLKFFQNKDYFDPTLWDFPQDYYYDNTTHFTIEELAAKFTIDPKTKKLIPRLKQATFDLGTKETEPADRSEMRALEKTGEPLKPTQTFKGELLDAPSAAPLPVDPEILRAIDATAAELANIYSENGLGLHAAGLSPTQIRAWIADQLLRPIKVMVREQLGSISNEKLAAILRNLKQFALSGQIDESNKFISGPEFHVNITDLLPGQWDILKSHLTFILDAIVVFNGKIVISMDGDEKAAQEKEAELRELARADGVELGKDQLKIVSVRDSKSFPLLTEGKPADAIMARKEEKLGPRNHARARSYWVTDDANDMKALSASILTALLYSLSDKNAFNPGTQHSNGHKTLLEAALNAIQGYQQIRTAA